LCVEFPCGIFVETVFEQGSDIEIGCRSRHWTWLYSNSPIRKMPIFTTLEHHSAEVLRNFLFQQVPMLIQKTTVTRLHSKR
jgi:hypothetical protein